MKKLLIVSLSFFLLSGCKKQLDRLPPATQIGANTFGCLLDGKAWLPTGGGFLSGVNPTFGGFFRNVDNSLNIYISANSDGADIDIFLKHASSPGTYYLNKNTDVRPREIFPESYGAYSVSGIRDYYVTDSLHSGVVYITYADTIASIVSGTFEMKLYQKNTGQQINITYGRFDYKNTLNLNFSKRYAKMITSISHKS